jgi:hypothetical protein
MKELNINYGKKIKAMKRLSWQKYWSHEAFNASPHCFISLSLYRFCCILLWSRIRGYWLPSDKYVLFLKVASTLWGICQRVASTLWHPITNMLYCCKYSLTPMTNWPESWVANNLWHFCKRVALITYKEETFVQYRQML